MGKRHIVLVGFNGPEQLLLEELLRDRTRGEKSLREPWYCWQFRPNGEHSWEGTVTAGDLEILTTMVRVGSETGLVGVKPDVVVALAVQHEAGVSHYEGPAAKEQMPPECGDACCIAVTEELGNGVAKAALAVARGLSAVATKGHRRSRPRTHGWKSV